MSARSDRAHGWLLLAARNLLLLFLCLNAWLYFRRELSLPFLAVCFLVAVAAALLLERLRLQIWAALPAFLALLFTLRALAFLVLALQRRLDPGPGVDFLAVHFDRNFWAYLGPLVVVWLFNFLARRRPGFLFLEAALNGVLLVALFWSQGNYRLTLYPHPSLYAAAVFLFLLLQTGLLLLADIDGEAGSGAGPGASAQTDGQAISVDPAGARGRLRSAAAVLWLLVPMLAVLALFLLGRFNQGAVQQGGGLMKPTLFRFDFSQYVKLESEIRMSDDLVMLLRKQGSPQRMLLRRYVLSGYERRRGFFSAPRQEAEQYPTAVGDAPERFPDPGYAARQAVGQEYFFVNFDPTSLVAMNYPIEVAPLTNWEGSSFLRIYRVRSRVSDAGEPELAVAGGGGLPADQLKLYTDYGESEEVRALAESIVAGAPADRYRRTTLIRDYLKSNYYYSLKPGLAADGDQLGHFLFESRKGYCSYFAFAMTLLCRSLGIPARVAVGFYVNPRAEVLNFYEVRAFQAHAWVEVYFGQFGWIEFDPSSETIAPGEEMSLQFGFDPERFARLIEEILQNQQALREVEPPAGEVARRGLPWARWLVQGMVRGLAWAARLWYLTVPLLYLALVLGAKALLLVSASAARDSRRRVRRLYLFTVLQLQGAGLVRRPDESPLEFAARLSEAGLRFSGWTSSYLEAVFAERFGPQQRQSAEGQLAAFRSSYRARYRPAARLLHLLNPVGTFRRRP